MFGRGLRQYEAWGKLKDQIDGYIKVDRQLLILRSESLKDRHWDNLKKKMDLPSLDYMVLGQVRSAALPLPFPCNGPSLVLPLALLVLPPPSHCLPLTVSPWSLGQVYDSNLKKHEELIKKTQLQAQGEMALEEFLKTTADTWDECVRQTALPFLLFHTAFLLRVFTAFRV